MLTSAGLLCPAARPAVLLPRPPARRDALGLDACCRRTLVGPARGLIRLALASSSARRATCGRAVRRASRQTGESWPTVPHVDRESSRRKEERASWWAVCGRGGGRRDPALPGATGCERRPGRARGAHQRTTLPPPSLPFESLLLPGSWSRGQALPCCLLASPRRAGFHREARPLWLPGTPAWGPSAPRNEWLTPRTVLELSSFPRRPVSRCCRALARRGVLCVPSR